MTFKCARYSFQQILSQFGSQTDSTFSFHAISSWTSFSLISWCGATSRARPPSDGAGHGCRKPFLKWRSITVHRLSTGLLYIRWITRINNTSYASCVKWNAAQMYSVMLTIADNWNATCVIVCTKVSRYIAIGKHPSLTRFLQLCESSIFCMNTTYINKFYWIVIDKERMIFQKWIQFKRDSDFHFETF